MPGSKEELGVHVLLYVYTESIRVVFYFVGDSDSRVL